MSSSSGLEQFQHLVGSNDKINPEGQELKGHNDDSFNEDTHEEEVWPINDDEKGKQQFFKNLDLLFKIIVKSVTPLGENLSQIASLANQILLCRESKHFSLLFKCLKELLLKRFAELPENMRTRYEKNKETILDLLKEVEFYVLPLTTFQREEIIASVCLKQFDGVKSVETAIATASNHSKKQSISLNMAQRIAYIYLLKWLIMGSDIPKLQKCIKNFEGKQITSQLVTDMGKSSLGSSSSIQRNKKQHTEDDEQKMQKLYDAADEFLEIASLIFKGPYLEWYSEIMLDLFFAVDSAQYDDVIFCLTLHVDFKLKEFEETLKKIHRDYPRSSPDKLIFVKIKELTIYSDVSNIDLEIRRDIAKEIFHKFLKSIKVDLEKIEFERRFMDYLSEVYPFSSLNEFVELKNRDPCLIRTLVTKYVLQEAFDSKRRAIGDGFPNFFGKMLQSFKEQPGAQKVETVFSVLRTVGSLSGICFGAVNLALNAERSLNVGSSENEQSEGEDNTTY